MIGHFQNRRGGAVYLAVCFFLGFAGVAFGDSIVVGDTAYEDVLVVTGDVSYYVLLPDEGKTISVPREEVDVSRVVISEDAAHRAALRQRYTAAGQSGDAPGSSTVQRQASSSLFSVGGQSTVGADIDAPALSVLEVLKEGTISAAEASIRVVEFWATWCGPCIYSIPHLTKLQAKYAPKGVVFFGVTNEKPELAGPYVANKGDEMNYTVLADYQSQTSFAYARLFGVSSIPHAYIVDSKGKIVWHGHPMAPEFVSTLDGLTL